ncbi:MAG: DUF2723 domain-containing protein [Leptospiraceae bacterium]|nr:DUF2723 domain-containing protein [Leptospiraceae bacterium]
MIFITSFLVYALTSPNTVTMEDSASFLITAKFLGVAHPPGYPLYVILGKIFSFLPFASVAYRIHLLNCFLASASLILFFEISYFFIKNMTLASISSFFLSISFSFWFQAITAEVYMLNLFLFLVLLFLGLDISQNWNEKKFHLFSFVFGLSLSNHWPLIILASLGFIVLFWKIKKEIISSLPKFMLFFLLGLVPYLHLYFSIYYSDYFFYGKLNSIYLVFEHIIRKEQWVMDSIQTAGFFQGLKFIKFVVLSPANEFSIPFVILVYLGIYFAYKELNRRYFYSLILFLISTPLLLLFSFRTEFNQFTSEMFQYWLLIPFSMMTIFAVFSLKKILEELEKISRLNQLAREVIFSIFILTLFAIQIYNNLPKNNLTNDTFARDYARLVLSSLPEYSVLLTNTDTDLGGQIGYVNIIENYRPDILITSQASALFPIRYYSRKDELDLQKRQILFLNFYSEMRKNGRRVFTTREINAFNKQFIFPLKYTQHGFYFEITENDETQVLDKSNGIPKAIQFLDLYSADYYKNHWQYYRNFALQSVFHYLGQEKIYHSITKKNRWCKLILAQLKNVMEKNFEEADRLFLEIIKDPMHDVYIFEKISIYRQFIINRIQRAEKENWNISEKKRYLQEAVDISFPVLKELEFCNNPLAIKIKELAQAKLVIIDSIYLEKTFPACKN